MEARDQGHYVIAMDGSADAPGLKEANEHHVSNILDYSEIVRVFRDSRAQAIVSLCCDAAMDAVAEACRRLSLPGIAPEVVHVSRNKILQRKALRAAGLLTPKFREAEKVGAALEAWDDFQSVACVVKPVDSSGSRGVIYVSCRENMAAAFETARESSPTNRVIVESFMPGIEYSVEAWVVRDKVHVLATSEKLRTQPPYLLDREVHFPGSLPPDRRRKMVECAVRAIHACGFRDCPVHLECIEHADGPMVVELAARGAGFKVFTEILPKVTGLSTARASIDAALGKSPGLEVKSRGSAASLIFLDPVPGVLKAVVGLDGACALPGVAEVVLYVRPGQLLNPLRSGADRAGHILVYDQDAAACRATARKALGLIQLEVES